MTGGGLRKIMDVESEALEGSQSVKHDAGNAQGKDVPQTTGIKSSRPSLFFFFFFFFFFGRVECGSVSANAAYHVS